MLAVKGTAGHARKKEIVTSEAVPCGGAAAGAKPATLGGRIGTLLSSVLQLPAQELWSLHLPAQQLAVN